MLYERWREVVRERRNEIALRDLASGRSWTFAQMDREAGKSRPHSSGIIFPQGHAAGFIFDVLRAWSQGRVVCPLDAHHQTMAVPSPAPLIAHLKLTPATTGAPRLVAFTENQLAADADNIVATMGLCPEWPNLGVISMAYSYGFSSLVLPLLLHGIPLILAPSPLPEMIRGAAKAHLEVTLPAVPALWHAWQNAGVIFNNIRLAISSGAPLSLSLERSVFERHGIKIHNFYGSTECGGIAYDGASVPRQDEASAGAPLKNVKVAANESGILTVNSQAVGETYWPEREETLDNGLFRTCDLGELDHGEVLLRGRISDQINMAGRKVSPAIIEQALREHKSVAECVVFGVPGGDALRIDLIVACVKAEAGSTQQELKQFLLRKLPSWQVPREWWFVESLGENGKSSRAQWRNNFIANRGKRLMDLQGRGG